ncbi:mCG146257, partial [Mus musculus]
SRASRSVELKMQLRCLILPLGSSQLLCSQPPLTPSSLPPQLEMIEGLLQRRKQIIRRLKLCNR